MMSKRTIIVFIILCWGLTQHGLATTNFDKINEFVRMSAGSGNLVLPEAVVKSPQAIFEAKKILDTLIVGYPNPNETLYVHDTTYLHYGDICVMNNGVILIENADFLNYGDIWLLNNGKLLADSSRVGFLQIFSWQFNFFTADNSELKLENSHFYANLFPALVNCGYNSQVSWINTYFDDWIAGFLCNQAEITIEDCHGLVGEYAFSDTSRGTFTRSGSLTVWLVFEEGDTVDYFPFHEEFVAHWILPDNLPLCKGVDYCITVDSCYILENGPWFHSGSDVTIRDCETPPIIRATGTDSFTISGLTPGTYYSDWEIPISDRRLRLVNTKVVNWHLHMQDTAIVTLENSIISEILSMNYNTLYMKSSTHDGKGGPFWIYGNSFIFADQCGISAETFVAEQGIFALSHGYLMSEFCLKDKGKSVLLNSRSFQSPRLLDESALYFASVDSPTVVPISNFVPIYGSAYIDVGPSSPYSFGSYRLWYAPPPTWDSLILIGLEHTEGVRDSLLGYWDTDSLEIGYYALWLTLKDNFGDSVQTYFMVRVSESGVEESEKIKVQSAKLKIYPNPFTQKTVICCQIPVTSDKSQVTRIQIYDLTGRLVKPLPVTRHSSLVTVVWDGENDLGEKVGSGVYFCKLTVGDEFSQTKKLLLFR